MFKDRKEAGQLLAKQLSEYKGKNVLVLGIPRGGIVVAKEISSALKLPLDVIVVRKIGHPGNPEYAAGAAGADNFFIREDTDLPLPYIEEQVAIKQREVRVRYHLFRGDKPMYSVEGKIVILVDDGIATGATMKMAVQLLKEQGAREMVVAVPVGPPSTIQELEEKGVKVVYLEAPDGFMAVGQYYRDFEQVEDEEVIALLK